MNKQFHLFFFLLLVVLSCSRCKEECNDPTNPDCPNYVPPTPVDPCAGSSEVSAGFIVEAIVDIAPIQWRQVDGVYNTQQIRVTAQQEGLNYKWIIGSDTIYDQQYTFYFPQGSEGQSYPIKLIVSGTIDSVCFPNDNGMDTIVKYLPVVDSCYNPIIGAYRIAWDSAPLDSFDVELICMEGVFVYGDMTAMNFDRNGGSCVASISGLGYNYYKLYSDAISCKRLRGEFWLNSDGLFEAQYRMDHSNSGPADFHEYHAKGRRIN